MIKLETDKQYIDKIENFKIDDFETTYKYRLSLKYILINLIISTLSILISIYVLDKIYKSNFLSILDYILLIAQVIVYGIIIYNFYKIFSYKIIVIKDKIIYDKTTINIKDINKLYIEYIKIKKNSYERSLVIETKKSEKYIFRMNISNETRFIKQISCLTNLKVNIKR